MPRTSLWRSGWGYVLEHSLLLVAGSVVALLWANVSFESYRRMADALRFPVNDIGMVFFFALAAKEVLEALLPGGALESPRRAAVPLLAAAGGMLLPALLYVALAAGSGHGELHRGWAIPCATDIAFSYLAARMVFGAKHAAIPFLLLLAIADDAGGLILLALFYPTGALRPGEFAILLGAAIALGAWMRRRYRASFWPYVLGSGLLSWIAFFRGGFHPALALVPIIPLIPHARADVGLFDPQELRRRDQLSRFEHWWTTPVQVILFFFGLVNAGVPFAAVGPGTWIVLAAILVGKPVGIVLFTSLASAMGLLRPAGLPWRDVLVLGCIAGIGFTVALFFTTAAFPPGPLLDQTKMGALLSFVAAPLSIVLARLLRAGRWS